MPAESSSNPVSRSVRGGGWVTGRVGITPGAPATRTTVMRDRRLTRWTPPAIRPDGAHHALEGCTTQAVVVALDERASAASAKLLAGRRHVRPRAENLRDALPCSCVAPIGRVDDDAAPRIANRVSRLALPRSDEENRPGRRHRAV